MKNSREQTKQFREYCSEHCETILTVCFAMAAGMFLVVAIV